MTYQEVEELVYTHADLLPNEMVSLLAQIMGCHRVFAQATFNRFLREQARQNHSFSIQEDSVI